MHTSHLSAFSSLYVYGSDVTQSASFRCECRAALLLWTRERADFSVSSVHVPSDVCRVVGFVVADVTDVLLFPAITVLPTPMAGHVSSRVRLEVAIRTGM